MPLTCPSSRRPLLALLGLSLLGLCLAASAQEPRKATPLQTPRAMAFSEPMEETRHGITLRDPYRWMEDKARADELTLWLKSNSELGMAQLGGLPRHAVWQDLALQALQTGTRYSRAEEAGGRLFFRRITPKDQSGVLVVRERGRDRVLFDPASEPGSAINRFSPSPDGRHVALLTSKAGGEVGDMRFIDVATGQETGRRYGPVWGEFAGNWLDNRHIILTRMGRDGDPMQTMVAELTELGERPVPVFGHGLPGTAATQAPELPILLPQPAGPWTLAAGAGARADARVLIAPTAAVKAGRPQWMPVAGYEDRVSAFTVRGNTLYVLSTRHHDRGEVLAARLDPSGRPGPWTSVYRATDAAFVDLAATRDGLYLSTTREGRAGIRYLPDGRGPGRVVPLPFEGSIESSAVSADGRRWILSLAGWTRPSSFQALQEGRMTPLGLDSEGWARAQTLHISRDEARSADGALVPMVLIRPDASDAPRPVLLEAYGSYGVPTAEPWYNPAFLSWAVGGHTLVMCGTRGGNERGRAWHEAGREARKPQAHADYIACAERLVARGLTKPGLIAATGTSAGGLLSPVAALQRPDLFRVIVPRVAITNATRLEAMSNGPNQYAEMGDPTTPDGFRALLAQDAYQLLLQRSPQQTLPDFLVTIGLNDRRVAPWMGAKLAAAAQALALQQGRPVVLVRADANAGHGMGSQRDVLAGEYADTFTFIENRLQAPSPSPSP